jgi:hypothetical protein
MRWALLVALFGLVGCGAKTGGKDVDAASPIDATVDAAPVMDSNDCGVWTGDPGNITEGCAVFASASATGTEDGSRASPYHTLANAVAHANGKHVYACDGAPFAETLTLTTAAGDRRDRQWTRRRRRRGGSAGRRTRPGFGGRKRLRHRFEWLPGWQRRSGRRRRSRRRRRGWPRHRDRVGRLRRSQRALVGDRRQRGRGRRLGLGRPCGRRARRQRSLLDVRHEQRVPVT